MSGDVLLMENTKNDQRGLEKDHKGECQRIQELMDFQEGRSQEY